MKKQEGGRMVRNKFEQFLQYRQSLLIQYRMGDLTKHEFVLESFHHLEHLGINPFERIDNVRKAIYNYHFYNVRAKYWQRMAAAARISEGERQAYHEASIDEYKMKDQATLRLLRLIEFKGVEAYPVVVHSKKLKESLIEILLTDPDVLMDVRAIAPMDAAVDGDDLVLHTRSTSIANVLRENGVFHEKKRHSLTGHYINQME
jgi:hypothetical protein